MASLYEKLGVKAAVEVAVDNFYEREICRISPTTEKPARA
jgi:hypothetical protein